MEMAKYILQILRSQPIVVFSWGFHRAYPISNGLRFSVNGYLHQGEVEVVYNDGSDLFEVRLSDGRVEVDVYADCLVNVIDGMVERCKDYDNRVSEEYSLTIHK